MVGNPSCRAQVPNGSFEKGAKWPDGWRVTGGIGAWENVGHSGKRCVSLTGDGREVPIWRSAPFLLQPTRTYLLSVWVKVAAGAYPSIAFGTSELFWEFSLDNREWHHYQFFFQSPSKPVSSYVRFWNWRQRCKLLFDDVTLVEAKVVHSSHDGVELGIAESVHGKLYRAGPEFPNTMGVAGPGCRILFRPQDGGFNGRWYVNPQGVVLRHQVGDVEQTEAWLKFRNGWNPRGKVIVSASKDGREFVRIYETKKLYWNGPIALPAKLFPAKEIFIRFECVDTSDEVSQAEAQRIGVCFELTGYEYQARLIKDLPELKGKTQFVEAAH